MPAPAPIFGLSGDAVALTAATARTLVDIPTPTGTGIVPVMWWVEFDGVSAASAPVLVEVGLFSAATTTGTTTTPYNLNGGDRGRASSIVAAKTVVTAEGAGTVVYTEKHRVSPTAGILIQEPLGNEWSVGASSFFRIRVTSATSVNATWGVRWQE